MRYVKVVLTSLFLTHLIGCGYGFHVKELSFGHKDYIGEILKKRSEGS